MNRMTRKMAIIGASLVMLLSSLLLPLVNFESYRWHWSILFHKLDRIFGNHALFNILGKTLLVIVVVFPVLLALVAWFKERESKYVAFLPLVTAVVFIALLFLAGAGLFPGIGLWIYTLASIASLVIAFRN